MRNSTEEREQLLERILAAHLAELKELSRLADNLANGLAELKIELSRLASKMEGNDG